MPMNSPGPVRELEFQNRLLAAVSEVGRHTRLSLTDIQGAIESVYNHRNAASHGECFDIGTAKAIRAEWFHWDNRPGGIFSVLFRNE
jgi:hypothetical protein